MKRTQNTRILRRLMLSLLPIQALAVGLPAVNTLLDSFIVGNYLGEGALAAIGFTSPLSMCVAAISSVLASGSQMICGMDLGKGDKDALHRTFNTTLILCIVFGMVISLLSILFPGTVAMLLGAVGENSVPTAGYIQGLAIGMTFSILSTSLLAFLQIEQMKKTSTAATTAMLLVNVGGNMVNVLFLHWGMFGVGFFMSMGSISAVLIATIGLAKCGKLFHFSPSSFAFRDIKRIIGTGAPAAITSMMNMIDGRVLNYFVFSLGGTVGMAAMSVANNVNTAIGNVIEAGYSGSGRIIASVLVGQRDKESLQDLPYVMAGTTAPITVTAYALVFIFARQLAFILGASPENIQVYVMAIRVFNVWFLTSLFMIPPLSIYHALGNIRRTSIVYVIGNVLGLVSIPLLQHFGLISAFTMPIIGESITILVFAILFTLEKHRLPKDPLDICNIPDTFTAPLENRYSTSISTVEEAVLSARQIYAFCTEKGLSKETALHCSLCIEEIAVDTVRNRFSKHASTIDLRILYENGHINIMVRDDCPYFDPIEWLKLCKPEDETRSLGIRMVTALAQEMNYMSNLGMNVLTIQL